MTAWTTADYLTDAADQTAEHNDAMRAEATDPNDWADDLSRVERLNDEGWEWND